MTARPLALALAALLALAPLSALHAAPAGAQPAGSPMAASDREKAAAHFKQGQAFFKRGDFDRAIAEYQAAFDLSAEPSLVFNIALCHNRANRPEPALQAYRRYLELAPNGNVADEAREEVARLAPIVDQRAAERAAKLEAERAAKLEAEEARRRERDQRAAQVKASAAQAKASAPPSRVPLYVVVAGAAVAAVGATSHVLAWRTRGRLESAPDPDAYFADRDTFKLQRAVAIGAYAAGAATLATGLVLGAVLRRGERPQVSATVAPGGAMVAVEWSR